MRHFRGALRPLGTVLEVGLRVRPSDAIRVLGALVRMILDLWAAPPRCGYLGELGIFFVLLPRIFGCGGSFTRAFLLGRLVRLAIIVALRRHGERYRENGAVKSSKYP